MQKEKADILAVAVWLIVLLTILRAQCHAQYMTLSMDSYHVEYDSVLLIPRTVEWMLSDRYLGESRREPSWRFAEDSRVPSPRACLDDYTHSGYDRGHMVPAADRSASKKAMRSTFTMTNVCPQAPALNRGAWKKVEDACRRYVRGGHQLRIVANALFWKADTQFIGGHRVAVPHGFTKTVYTYPDDSIIFTKYFPNL